MMKNQGWNFDAVNRINHQVVQEMDRGGKGDKKDTKILKILPLL